MDEETKDRLALLLPHERERIRAGDLNSLSFCNQNLSNLDFSNSNLKNVDFRRSTLSHSCFTRCNLEGAHLDYCTIEAGIFVDANLKFVTCREAVWDHSWIIRCLLEELIALEASFVRVDFTGSVFKKNNFVLCGFEGCVLNSVERDNEQETLKRSFLGSLRKLDDKMFLAWRVLGKDGFSLLGTKEEKPGDTIEIPILEVSLDERAGCATGLSLCKTPDGAAYFGKQHLKEFKIVPIGIKADWLLIVHMSGDFGRTYKYVNREDKND